MASDDQFAVHPNQNAGIAGERRQDRRYDIRLDLRWKLIRRRRILESGTGRTLDLSSGGVHFETDRPLPVGLNVELSIAWPALLHKMAPMQLVAYGKIVRSRAEKTAMQMQQHEFRTVGITAEQRAAQNPRTQTHSALLGSNSGFMNMGKSH